MRQILDNIQINIPFHMLGDGYMDLFMEHGLNPEIGLDAHSLDSCNKGEFAQVARRFLDQGRQITVHGPFMDLSPGSSDPAIREVTRRRLDQVLGLISGVPVRSVVCHGGYDSSRCDTPIDEWLERALGIWNWFGAEIRQLGSRLMLENVYEQHAQELALLFDHLEETTTGFCFDAGHMHAFGDGCMQDWLSVLGHRINQIHLHDNNGSKDEHLALGKGSIPFASLFELLIHRGKEDIIVTMEPHTEADLWPGIDYLSSHLAAFFEKPPGCETDKREPGQP